MTQHSHLQQLPVAIPPTKHLLPRRRRGYRKVVAGRRIWAYPPATEAAANENPIAKIGTSLVGHDGLEQPVTAKGLTDS